jgi:hypothetical protein
VFGTYIPYLGDGGVTIFGVWRGISFSCINLIESATMRVLRFMRCGTDHNSAAIPVNLALASHRVMKSSSKLGLAQTAMDGEILTL